MAAVLHRRGRLLAVAVLVLGLGVTILPLSNRATAKPAHRHPAVLRVGTWHGVHGQYKSIQAAVRAAHPGDYVLVGPGDYKENGYHGETEPAGVLITTPRLHLRGMNRNRVVIDGTKRKAPQCSKRKKDQ